MGDLITNVQQRSFDRGSALGDAIGERARLGLGAGKPKGAELSGATTSTRVGDVEHDVTPRQIGGRTQMWICSKACGTIHGKIDDMLDHVPAGQTGARLRKDLEALKERVSAIEKRLAEGQKSLDVTEQSALIANKFQALGERYKSLGKAIDDPEAITQEIVENGARQTVKVSQYNDIKFADEQDLLYVLRDTKSGAVLKVGKTTGQATSDRFRFYETAERKFNENAGKAAMELELEVMPIKLENGKKLHHYEELLRSRMEAEGHVMPWDNSRNPKDSGYTDDFRLDHRGQGTPFASQRSDSGLMWTKDGNAVEKGSGKPATFTRKNAAPSKDDVIGLLKKHKGDIKAIAADKNITYQAVWNWLKAYNLKATGFRNSTH